MKALKLHAPVIIDYFSYQGGRHPIEGPRCGSKGYTVLTHDKSQVTCKRCLRIVEGES